LINPFDPTSNFLENSIYFIRQIVCLFMITFQMFL
jgi:hypothetical protein